MYRDNLEAAHARINELEDNLERMCRKNNNKKRGKVGKIFVVATGVLIAIGISSIVSSCRKDAIIKRTIAVSAGKACKKLCWDNTLSRLSRLSSHSAKNYYTNKNRVLNEYKTISYSHYHSGKDYINCFNNDSLFKCKCFRRIAFRDVEIRMSKKDICAKISRKDRHICKF